MKEDEFYQLNKGDTVRFKNYMEPDKYNYYQVEFVLRVTHQYGVPMPAFKVWIVPLNSYMMPIPNSFSREVVSGDKDMEWMELVTV